MCALVLALAVSCTGGTSSRTPTATVSAVSSPATEAPSATAAPGAILLRVGESAEIPEGVALIVETGCWQCDGDYGRLVRIYRDASGALQETPLLNVRGGHAVSPDGSQVAYSWCSRGACDGFNPTSPDVQSSIQWSNDGGITATTFGPFDGVYDVATVTRGLLVASGQTADLQPLPLLRFPSGDVFTPPPGGAYPVSVGWDYIDWLTADRTAIQFGPDVGPLDLGAGHEIARVQVESPSGDRLLVDWHERLPDGDIRFYASIASWADQRWRIDHTFLLDGSVGRSGLWLDADTLIGTYEFRAADLSASAGSSNGLGSYLLPALFDLKTNTLHPIVEPFASKPPYAGGRNFVLAVMRGPFARVANTGSCLNLRTEPRADAPVRICAADKVLLRTLGHEETADGTAWIAVAMPDGVVDGWVSDEFIDR